MTLNTQTITTFGSQTAFTYTGGSGAVTLTGAVNGVAALMISLDGTNFSEAGRLTKGSGMVIGNIPACDMRWDVISNGLEVNPNFVVSVETV